MSGERSPAGENKFLPLTPVEGVEKTSSLSEVGVVLAISSYLRLLGEANMSVLIALRGVSGGGGMDIWSNTLDTSSFSLSDHSKGSLLVSWVLCCDGLIALGDIELEIFEGV